MPRGGIFLGKWLSSFAGNSDGKINVQAACALNIWYKVYETRNYLNSVLAEKTSRKETI
jgi:hypothetical protein